MARSRNFAREYQQRLAKAAREGRTRRSARGHEGTPDRPAQANRRPWEFERYMTAKVERMARLSDERLAEWNIVRLLEGRPELTKADPGAGEGRSQTFGSFDAAENYVSAIPSDYVVLFPQDSGVWGARIARAA